MLYLILCIFSSTAIFVVFKVIGRAGIPSFPVIVINYLTATILGFLLYRGPVNFHAITGSGWFPMSLLIGFLFIVMFFLVAWSSKKAGLSVTTVASKMSVVFPILFSLCIDESDRLSLLKSTAIILSLPGVALTVYKPRSGPLVPSVIYFPLLLFVGMGIVDSLVKFAQHRFVSDSQTALFSAVLFLMAFTSGVLVWLMRRRLLASCLEGRIWLWGIILGSVNFGSIYFIVRALNYISPAGSGIDSSVIFGVNNTGIVVLSVLLGYFFFRERLLRMNWAGIFISILALVLFTLAE